MRLDARGHPLHTRALTVTLAARPDRKLDVAGSVLDLRKRGFVPVAGELQASGVIHQMLLHAVVDPATGRLETIAAEQPTVAFEPSAATGGESCRDPIARVQAVAGAAVGAELAQRLAAEIGGPRGCSHVLTLGRLLASTTAWALERDRGAPVRRPGERVFRRDVVVDAHEEAEGRLLFAVQLGDLHVVPTPPRVPPMDAFGGHREVQAVVRVDFGSRSISAATVSERERRPATLAGAAWRVRPEVDERLAGLPLGAGGTVELLRRMDGVADPPLLDALLMLAPTLVQCLAALADTLPLAARASGALGGIGGLPDSCWMWRRGGALSRR
jgi:hypothetical protein